MFSVFAFTAVGNIYIKTRLFDEEDEKRELTSLFSSSRTMLLFSPLLYRKLSLELIKASKINEEHWFSFKKDKPQSSPVISLQPSFVFSQPHFASSSSQYILDFKLGLLWKQYIVLYLQHCNSCIDAFTCSCYTKSLDIWNGMHQKLLKTSAKVIIIYRVCPQLAFQ